MNPREELDLILKLIRKYNLPLSPILEYAINEKKEEFPDGESKETNNEPIIQPSEKRQVRVIKVESKDSEEEQTIELTREIIEAARTPNGGFTKRQLNAIGVDWPAPKDWIEQKTGILITRSQLEKFNHIEYLSKPASSMTFGKGSLTYLNVATSPSEAQKMVAILEAMEHFIVPATPRDIARAISRSAWGRGAIKEDSVDSFLKRLPEVEYVPKNKYILKRKKGK